MNSTRAVEVSIQAVSPELIFDESTENGAVGAAGAASEAAAADAAAGADASWASAEPTPAPRSDPAMNRDINNLRILRFPLIAVSFIRERPRRFHRCGYG